MGNIWSTLIVCAVIIIICIFAVRSYLKKVRNGCCGGDSDEIKPVPMKNKDFKQYPYAKKVLIEGMYCKNCAIRIQNSFIEQGYYANVDLKRKCGIIRAKHTVTDDELRRIVEQCGYKVIGFDSAE